MSSAAISLIVFVCVSAGSLLGMSLRRSLPERHFIEDSKETVKLGMGFVSTMSALVLGLLVSSAKSFYDTQSAEVNQLSADIVALDRLLDHYGPETKEAREALRSTVMSVIERIWNRDPVRSREAPASERSAETLLDKVQALVPQNEKQRLLQGQAVNLVIGIGRIRWLMYEQSNASVSQTLLTVMVFWLTVVFTSFGLFAPRNATAVVSLLAAGLSVSGAIFLICDMYVPYRGLVQISSAPLRSALAHLGQ